MQDSITMHTRRHRYAVPSMVEVLFFVIFCREIFGNEAVL